MKRIYYLLITALLYFQTSKGQVTSDNFFALTYSTNKIDSLYHILKFTGLKPTYQVFYGGITGYNTLVKEMKIQNSRYLTLVDFSLSSNKRRLWVIDLIKMEVIYNSLVSHGKNTGVEFASKFSNTPSSHMSSLGFYITGSTYYGKYGLSLYLNGVEPGVNDNAMKRTIVMHGAQYATIDFVNKYGRLGRSYGCLAVPPSKGSAIIETIKNKSCLFVYYPDKKYLASSKYLKKS